MNFKFTKMQALGNDFVVINLISQSISISAEFIQLLADRHRGVGCDQVLLLTQSNHTQADFGSRIFNADGGEVFQCGNGARCIGLYVWQNQLSDKKIICFETTRGIIRAQRSENSDIIVDIAKPDFNPTGLPFCTAEKKPPYHLQLAQHTITFDVVSVGNPHCVIVNSKLSETDKISIGKQLNAHPAFPEGVNVGFVKMVSRQRIDLCVYERGVGMTQACGSGACAAVAVGIQRDALDRRVTVQQMGGAVVVEWKSLDLPIQLSGTANTVFEGVWKEAKLPSHQNKMTSKP
ncbi:MAG: diaminopimelate epimerase [uncultured bacterium]|nr:MAG: diaminopimelate epimerase [uncultured bacterium]